MKHLLSACLSILFIAFTAVCFAQQTPPSTDVVMKAAYQQAAKEQKNVLVIFHASWCVWCKKMEASINHPSIHNLFANNYVVVYLDVMEQPEKKNLENAGSLELMKTYKGEKAGLPFWFITDARGKELADSQLRAAGAGLNTPGENVGCPAEDKEVSFFIQVLKSTSHLNNEQLALIAQRFSKNKPAPEPATAPSIKPSGLK